MLILRRFCEAITFEIASMATKNKPEHTGEIIGGGVFRSKEESQMAF
jgi:hypothetical protein